MIELVGFLVTNFQGYYPVGTCAVVYATDRGHAKGLLLDELRSRGLGQQDPNSWTLEPITPAPRIPTVRVILDGDY